MHRLESVGFFYKAIMQAVLLFGSESWCLLSANMRSLEGFHIRAVRRMTGMIPKKLSDDSWQYPDSAEVLKAACLHIAREYIQVQRHIVMRLCQTAPSTTTAGKQGRTGAPGHTYTGWISRWSWRR